MKINEDQMDKPRNLDKRTKWLSSTSVKVEKHNRPKSRAPKDYKKEESESQINIEAEESQSEKDDRKIISNEGGIIELQDGDCRIKINQDIDILDSFRKVKCKFLRLRLMEQYSKPSVIQKYCIPVVTSGNNLLCRAPTGMGKTMCFLIPIIENYVPSQKPQACIVCPTRELCDQIKWEAIKLVNGRNIHVDAIYGKKADRPSYDQTDIIAATPGRFLDLLKSGRVDISQIKTFVLDEADKLLDMGFEMPIKEIYSFAPKNVQTCLFSATYSAKLTRMINYFLPEQKVSIEVVSETVKSIKQEIMNVGNKKRKLLSILKSDNINLERGWRAKGEPDKILIFVERKVECRELENFLLESDIPSVTLHGDKDQADRNEALRSFKMGTHNIMVATSVAARGIDVKDVKLVINYDIPKDIKEYIHRIGRTGREGKSGWSISFYDNSVNKEFKKSLVKVLEESGNTVPEFLLDSEDFDERFERLKLVAGKEETSDDETVGLW